MWVGGCGWGCVCSFVASSMILFAGLKKVTSEGITALAAAGCGKKLTSLSLWGGGFVSSSIFLLGEETGRSQTEWRGVR